MSPKRRSVVMRLARKHGYVCALCGERITKAVSPLYPDALTIDHKIPKSRGGGFGIENLQLAHRVCNEAKADKMKGPTDAEEE